MGGRRVPLRALGRLTYLKRQDVWLLECEPHVSMMAKRIFAKLPRVSTGQFKLANTPENCRDLEWFSLRYPLEIPDVELLRTEARNHREHIATLDDIIGGCYQPREFNMALPPREYQSVAAELVLRQKELLLADEVGTGKTATAITVISDFSARPTAVVCPANLVRQWQAELKRFVPQLYSHIIRSGSPYKLPQVDFRSPDVLIISYHKLAGWVQVLRKYVQFIVFDEVQELRHSSSQKYEAAVEIAHHLPLRLGLSATPIHNFGGEFFNVLQVVVPGRLGTREEFLREWCRGGNSRNPSLKHPDAFGSWLYENKLMLRRTRREIGRELEPMTKVVHAIDSDREALDRIEDQAGELARIILQEAEEKPGQKLQAREQFSMIMRQATGLAKAPHVAAFVKLLLDSGEPVVLFGWHRAVYEIWGSKLKDYNPVFYTGEESISQKVEAVRKFTEKETDLFIISLRSGAGLDGLQKRCRTVVIGELDWAPAVIEQDIGRVWRDGQTDPVTAYLLVADDGCDPFMTRTLGLKREQIEGVLQPGRGPVLERMDTGDMLRALAVAWLERRGDDYV